MSETNINLGPVSAYALAKSKGYTGTADEFAQLMANYATVGQQAAQSAAIASTAANTANTKASEAATSANNAATSATNASRSATAASQSATAASNSASSAATSAQTANAKSTEATNSANAASQSAGSASQYSQQALTARTAAQAAQTAAESAKTAAEAAAAESRADYTTLNTKVDNTKTALEAEIDAVSDDVADLDTAVQSKASTTALQAETARATAEEARIEALFTAPTEEAVADWLEAHPEATTTVQDGAISYAKLDSTLKAKADDVSDLKSSIGQMKGFNAQTKAALLALFQKCAFVDDDAQTYYDALEDALYPPADVDHINAVYTQSGTVYDTDSLDVLKSDLVVTAYYDDGTSAVITNYTLSGTLTEGTSTITVSYGGKTTMFNVTVSVRTYAYVDYVESDGACVVSTGLVPADTKCEAKFQYTVTPSTDTTMVGRYDSSNANQRYFPVHTNGRGQFTATNRGNTSNVNMGSGDTNVHTIIWNDADGQVIFDGAVKSTRSDYDVSGSTVNVFFYACTSALLQACAGRIYYAKFWDNTTGNLIGDFRPCYRIADGAIGFHDLVTDTFHGNDGSGTLTKGADL